MNRRPLQRLQIAGQIRNKRIQRLEQRQLQQITIAHLHLAVSAQIAQLRTRRAETNLPVAHRRRKLLAVRRRNRLQIHILCLHQTIERRAPPRNPQMHRRTHDTAPALRRHIIEHHRIIRQRHKTRKTCERNLRPEKTEKARRRLRQHLRADTAAHRHRAARRKREYTARRRHLHRLRQHYIRHILHQIREKHSERIRRETRAADIRQLQRIRLQIKKHILPLHNTLRRSLGKTLTAQPMAIVIAQVGRRQINCRHIRQRLPRSIPQAHAHHNIPPARRLRHPYKRIRPPSRAQTLSHHLTRRIAHILIRP